MTKRVKVRAINWHADEYIAGTFGQLTVIEHGVYTIIINLIYSRSKPIEDDHKFIAHACRNTDPRTIRAAIDHLVEIGKIHRLGHGIKNNFGDDLETMKLYEPYLESGIPLLAIKRCLIECRSSRDRIEIAQRSGREGGLSRNKINGLESDTLGNHEPLTTKKEEDLVPRSSKKEPARPIPPDWQPNQNSITKAIELGFNEHEISWQADKLRNWATAGDKRYARWDAVFDNWIKSTKERLNAKNGYHHDKPSNADIQVQAFADGLARRTQARNQANGRSSQTNLDPTNLQMSNTPTDPLADQLPLGTHQIPRNQPH